VPKAALVVDGWRRVSSVRALDGAHEHLHSQRAVHDDTIAREAREAFPTWGMTHDRSQVLAEICSLDLFSKSIDKYFGDKSA